MNNQAPIFAEASCAFALRPERRWSEKRRSQSGFSIDVAGATGSAAG